MTLATAPARRAPSAGVGIALASNSPPSAKKVHVNPPLNRPTAPTGAANATTGGALQVPNADSNKLRVAVPKKFLQPPEDRQANGYTCGPNSAKAALDYWGLGGDQNLEDIAKAMGTNAKEGTEPEAIAAYVRNHGVNAEVESGLTIDDLRKYTSQGKLVQVTYQAYADRKRISNDAVIDGQRKAFPLHDAKGNWLWKNDWTDGHYSLVIGVDDKYVWLQDPSNNFGRSIVPIEEFMDRWHDTNKNNEPVFNQTGIVMSPKTPPKVLNRVYVEWALPNAFYP